MARDDTKLLELRQVSAELDRRATRLDSDQAQLAADRIDLDTRTQDAAIQRQLIAEQRVNLDRVVRTYSGEKDVTTRLGKV